MDVNLSSSTRLGEDLRIVGDDADEFLEDFSVEFNVDFSTFRFEQYFPGEATASMHYYLLKNGKKSPSSIFRVINVLERGFWRIFTKEKSFKSITLSMLFEAAQSGKWKENVSKQPGPNEK